MPAVITLLVFLVLDGDLGEMAEDVFCEIRLVGAQRPFTCAMLTDLGVTAAAGLAAKVIKPFNLVHEVVNNGDDNRDT